jgi:hypothetical protein
MHTEVELTVLRISSWSSDVRVGGPRLRRGDRLFIAAIAGALPRSRWSSFMVSPQTLEGESGGCVPFTRPSKRSPAGVVVRSFADFSGCSTRPRGLVAQNWKAPRTIRGTLRFTTGSQLPVYRKM